VRISGWLVSTGMFSLPVRCLLSVALAAAAIAIVSTSDGPTTVRSRTRALAHAALCTAMIAMLWPIGAVLPAPSRALALTGIATWFLALALRSRPWPRLSELGQLGHWGGLASLHHAVTAAAMTWMTLDMRGGHHSMPATMPAGISGVAAALGGYFLIAALPWLRGRGLHAAGNAAMSIAMGVLLIAGP
jgi:hypothetical protein